MQHKNNKKGKGNTNEVKILIIKHKGHPHSSGYPDCSINIVIGQSKHVPLHHHLQGIIKDNEKETKQQHYHHPNVDRDEKIHHQYSHHYSQHNDQEPKDLPVGSDTAQRQDNHSTANPTTPNETTGTSNDDSQLLSPTKSNEDQRDDGNSNKEKAKQPEDVHDVVTHKEK